MPSLSHDDAGAAGSRRERVLAAAADRLPLGLRTVRVAPTARAVLGLALIGLLAATAAAVLYLRSRPQEIRAPVRVPIVAPAPGPSEGVGGGRGSARASPTALLVVDVVGPVRNPGVVRLPPGSRVIDALAAAGGLKPGAGRGGLNLAAVLTDGQQVVVGGPGPPPAAMDTSGPANGTQPSGLVDLNTATLAQLDALPGVGPVLAQRILDWRTANGRFTAITQLAEIGGIGERKMADLRALVRV